MIGSIGNGTIRCPRCEYRCVNLSCQSAVVYCTSFTSIFEKC
ncbi:unnamed protein product [Brugia timori]|uniref:Uncharacterized protein n=1 Tax=Brugia timori TaxID=42155 RepID=A0A0R3QB67_9BILA|nr:unnamed protein product [Brugia timori]